MTKKFSCLFKRSPPTLRSHYPPHPRYYSDSFDDDDFQSDIVEKVIPPVHPIIQPIATPSTTADDHSQFSQILELPKEARARFVRLQCNATQLKIDSTTAPNIFANMHDPLSASYGWDVKLFNQVEKLFIEDMEGAQALAQAIEDYRFSRTNISSRYSPTTDVFVNVKTISFGSQFTESLAHSTENIRYLRALHTIGGTLKPSHICLAQPFNRSDEYLDLLDSVSALMNHGRLESLTAHGFWFYSGYCIPSSLKTLNIIFGDCPSSNNYGKCVCKENLVFALVVISDESGFGEGNSVIKGKEMNLINLPHISPDMLTLKALTDMRIKDEPDGPIYEDCDFGNDKKIVDYAKEFQANSEWFKKNFKVIKKEGAKPCICCGKV
ncbi:hypothetical protein V866_007817 [Kwoniella sp. B9012]